LVGGGDCENIQQIWPLADKTKRKKKKKREREEGRGREIRNKKGKGKKPSFSIGKCKKKKIKNRVVKEELSREETILFMLGFRVGLGGVPSES
jgi:hypothetical protein